MGRLSNKRQRCDTEASAPKRSKREETNGATKQATSKKKATGKAAGRKKDLDTLNQALHEKPHEVGVQGRPGNPQGVKVV
jgi:hypothetical protein